MERKILFSLLSSLTFLPLICSAASPSVKSSSDAGFYFGAPGYAFLHYDSSWLKKEFKDTPFIHIEHIGNVENSGWDARLYVDYQFMQNFAVELGYAFLPKVEYKNVKIAELPDTPVKFSFNQALIISLLAYMRMFPGHIILQVVIWIILI